VIKRTSGTGIWIRELSDWLQSTDNETFLYKDLPPELKSKKHFYRAVAEDLLKKAGKKRVYNGGDKRTVWRVAL